MTLDLPFDVGSRVEVQRGYQSPFWDPGQVEEIDAWRGPAVSYDTAADQLATTAVWVIHLVVVLDKPARSGHRKGLPMRKRVPVRRVRLAAQGAAKP